MCEIIIAQIGGVSFFPNKGGFGAHTNVFARFFFQVICTIKTVVFNCGGHPTPIKKRLTQHFRLPNQPHIQGGIVNELALYCTVPPIFQGNSWDFVIKSIRGFQLLFPLHNGLALLAIFITLLFAPAIPTLIGKNVAAGSLGVSQTCR